MYRTASIGSQLDSLGAESDCAALELSATDFSHYRARYYDENIGRFASEDPIGFRGGIDLYAYAANNPINLRDPRGLFAASPSSGGCPPKRDCKKEYDDCRKRAQDDYATCMKNAQNAFQKGVQLCQAWRLL